MDTECGISNNDSIFYLVGKIVNKVGIRRLLVSLNKTELKNQGSERVSLSLSLIEFRAAIGGFMLSFIWGKVIEGYRVDGQGYGEIFKHKYRRKNLIEEVYYGL